MDQMSLRCLVIKGVAVQAQSCQELHKPSGLRQKSFIVLTGVLEQTDFSGDPVLILEGHHHQPIGM